MVKNVLFLTGIGLINLILFLGIFTFLQNENNYNHTLGKFSYNYEKTGTWNNYEIKKVAKRYVEISNKNFENWDASIYECISKRMYSPESDCYGMVRGAFFPLFPILWKITAATPVGISLINYFLFVLSIALLVTTILKTSTFDKFIIYAVLIALPSTIVYHIPYTEALFLFTMTLAAIGILKNRYWLFFTGALLTEMIRPAASFVILAILFTEVLLLIKNGNFKLFVKKAFGMAIPFLLGCLIAIFMQYTYTSSWITLFEAQKHWYNGIHLFKTISDWSVEGFGLSSFSIFFVCIPSLVYIVFLFFRKNNPDAEVNTFNFENGNKAGYLFLISIFYLTGIFIFALLTTGGSLHSFFRYTLSTPLFYIALLILLNGIYNKPIKLPLYYFIISLVLIALFLNLVKYGGDRISFSFFGLYLFILSSLFLIFRSKLPKPMQIISVILLVVFNIFWTTYMLNVFFCDGWIFT